MRDHATRKAWYVYMYMIYLYVWVEGEKERPYWGKYTYICIYANVYMQINILIWLEWVISYGAHSLKNGWMWIFYLNLRSRSLVKNNIYHGVFNMAFKFHSSLTVYGVMARTGSELTPTRAHTESYIFVHTFYQHFKISSTPLIHAKPHL